MRRPLFITTEKWVYLSVSVTSPVAGSVKRSTAAC